VITNALTWVFKIVWFEDFPITSAPVRCEFRRELEQLLDSFGVSKQYLQNYDFSKTQARLIVSIPGKHSDEDLEKYGHMRLRSVVYSLHLEPHGSTTIDYQVRSYSTQRLRVIVLKFFV
jgi:hypothetical protein